MPAGAPSKYFQVITHREGQGCLDLGQIEILNECGLIDEQICKILNVSVPTYEAYKKKSDKLLKAISDGKRVSDATVKASLYKRANGFFYEETTTDKNGDITTYMKYEVPNTAAAIHWLGNRQRVDWNNQQYMPEKDTSFPTEIVFQVKETNGVESEEKKN